MIDFKQGWCSVKWVYQWVKGF